MSIELELRGKIVRGEKYYELVSFGIEIIKLAGARLQTINARLKKENEGWEGSLHTIII